MLNEATIDSQSQPNQSSIFNQQSELYKNYLKPGNVKLMELLKLNVIYETGHGNWLTLFAEDGTRKKIFDAAGGYGANLMGHKNPELENELFNLVKQKPPLNVQNSIRSNASELGAKISSILTDELAKGPWITNLSNTGTEAIEAALKLSLLRYRKNMDSLRIDVNKSFNSTDLAIGPDNTKYDHLLPQVRFQIEKLGIADDELSGLDLSGLLNVVKNHNLGQISKRPIFVALQGAFHGKTLGSLSVTHNPFYRDLFYCGHETVFVSRTNTKEIAETVSTLKKDLYLPRFEGNELKFSTKKVNTIAASLIEPIQGEAGVKEVPLEVLRLFRKLADRLNFILIFDEIQAGLYRTGTFTSGAPVCADVYCFAKGLGGGLSKIGATSVIKNKFQQKFGLLHTSTFAEDSISSGIALKVLDILTGSNSPVRRSMEVALYLKSELEKLREKFPKIIKEVRGRGLMLAIEFCEDIKYASHEFKLFGSLNTIGYLFSSYLLHIKGLRTFPTLSNQFALRIEPSLYMETAEVNYLVEAIASVVSKIEQIDFRALFGHVHPNVTFGPVKLLNEKLDKNRDKSRSLAVFLTHLIDAKQGIRLFRSYKNMPLDQIEAEVESFADFVEFDIYGKDVLKGVNGKEIDIIFIGIPITSKLIIKMFRGGGRSDLVSKVQRAINFAKELGATTVGLGQFTSIITANGLYVDSRGMNITTGNAYTVSLAVAAMLRGAKNNGLSLHNCSVACVGAAGNIVSISASLLVDEVKKIGLFHRTPPKNNKKFSKAILNILNDISLSDATSPCVLGLQKVLSWFHPQNRQELMDFMELEEVREFLEIHSSMEILKNYDLVITGTNSHRPFIVAEYFKHGAVVLDIAVPGDVDKSTLESREDVKYMMGGIANLPSVNGEVQSIKSRSFPLTKGVSFACMAETFAIELNALKSVKIIGKLSKNMVQQAKLFTEDVGFSLGPDKVSNSL